MAVMYIYKIFCTILDTAVIIIENTTLILHRVTICYLSSAPALVGTCCNAITWLVLFPGYAGVLD